VGLARRFVVLALLGAMVAVPAASAQPSAKIIGGTPAAAGEFPYQVLLDANGFQCGGSIVSPTRVVTAAHCLEDIGPAGYPEIFLPSTITVFYGGVDRDEDGGGPDGDDMEEVGVDVVSVDRRRNRNLGSEANDAAVLTLDSAIDLTPADTDEIDLATAPQLTSALGNADPADEPWITGWGLTVEGDDSSAPEIMRKVRVPLVGDGACNSDYGGGLVTSVMLCAGDRVFGNRDTCQGDSGGPLAIDIDPNDGVDNLRLAGITSFGFGCGDADFPGVYAEVPEAGTTNFINLPSHVDPPRVSAVPRTTGTARVGQTVTCVPPSPLPAGVQVTEYLWYAFVGLDYDQFSPGAGQQAVIPAAAQGRRVECDVRLETDGGYQYLDGTAGGIGPVTAAAAPGVTPPPADTTRPRARVQRVRCGRRRSGRRRCTVRIKATDVGGLVKRVSARVKGRYRRCTRRADGTRRCRTRRVNRRLRLRKHKGGIYTSSIRLRKGRYTAYARARDTANLLSRLSRKRFRVR
jgi:hypothetical protein